MQITAVQILQKRQWLIHWQISVYYTINYRVFINYCVFPLNFVIFLNSASSAAALVFYLPGVCTHTDTKGKQRKARVQNILKSLEKNTIFNEHPADILLHR